jgi:antitoxin component of MazEF toxin-antitoxin module
MTKNLIKHGNSWALVIDRPILDLLQIDPDTPLELSTNGDVLVISPQRDEKRRKRFQSALKEINQKYGNALKRLAE